MAILRIAKRGGRLSAAPIAWALSILFVLSFQLNAGEPEAHGFNGLDNPDQYDNAELTWRKANMTWYESYPEPGSEECIKYNGCFWEGKFTLYGDEKKPLEWVANTHILSVHSKDFDKYKGKVLRLRKDGKQIDAMVFDSCSDDDCDGCCSENCKETGFLIDMEIHTLEKFGVEQGVVEWTCLDCEE